MRNQYFALRHGISVANEKGIIVSHPASGVGGWGLSERGATECRQRLTPERLQACGLSPDECVVYSSDFLRAVETATLLCKLNHLSPAILDVRLRERHFGSLEKRTIDAYDLVWSRDADDDNHGFEGCESTAKLAARLRSLLGDLESRWNGKKIVLVSHGDPLQVLQTILLGLRCNQHRSLPDLGNAEMRRIDGVSV